MLVKDELLDKVVARVREQLPEDQAPLVEEFVRQYYAWITPEDLARPFPHRPLRGSGGPLGVRQAANTRLAQDQGVQPAVRGARLAIHPHRARDRHRRHAVPRGLDADGDKPRRVRDPPHAPPHNGCSGATTRAGSSRSWTRRRKRHHLRVRHTRGDRPADRARGARKPPRVHHQRPRSGPHGRRGLAGDAREGPTSSSRR